MIPNLHRTLTANAFPPETSPEKRPHPSRNSATRRGWPARNGFPGALAFCAGMLALVPGPRAAAAESGAAGEGEPKNRFQVGGRLGFNLRADFSGHARLLVPAGPEAGGGVDRAYADGAVRIDASGNADSSTWNWAYSDARQIRPDGSGIDMHAYSGNPLPDSSNRTDDPHPGIDLTYSRLIGEWAGAQWGMELGLNWLQLDLKDDSGFSGNLDRSTDYFALDGVIPPEAPYSGSFDGPGPILGAIPTRTLDTVTTRVAGQRQLEGDLLGFKLGPVLDIPLGDWLSAQLSGGLALAHFDGAFRFAETVLTSDGSALRYQGEASADEWLLGGYARGQLSVRLTESLGLYAAAEYLGLESVRLEAEARHARLDLSGGLYISAGVSVRF